MEKYSVYVICYKRIYLSREFSKTVERDQSTHSKGSMKPKLDKYNKNHTKYNLANCWKSKTKNINNCHMKKIHFLSKETVETNFWFLRRNHVSMKTKIDTF